MGAGVSGLAADAQRGFSLKPGLDDVPESCISSIFMYLDPPEICKLASLNRAFLGASLADFVWETKLPSNYRYLVKKVLDQSPESLSKKETYARLCRPNRFDGGTKVAFFLLFASSSISNQKEEIRKTSSQLNSDHRLLCLSL